MQSNFYSFHRQSVNDANRTTNFTGNNNNSTNYLWAIGAEAAAAASVKFLAHTIRSMELLLYTYRVRSTQWAVCSTFHEVQRCGYGANPWQT